MWLRIMFPQGVVRIKRVEIQGCGEPALSLVGHYNKRFGTAPATM